MPDYNNTKKSTLKERFKNFKKPQFLLALEDNESFVRFRNLTYKYSIIINIIISLGVTFIVEWLSRRSFIGTCSFFASHPASFLFNAYIIFVALSLSYLSRRRIGIRMIICGVFFFLAYVNCIVLMNRVTPFGFTDFTMLSDLFMMKNTNYFSSQQAFFTGLFFTIYGIVATVILILENRQPVKFKLPFRAIFVALCFLSVPLTTKLLQSANVMSSYFGNLAQGYSDYGFLYGFGMSVFEIGMNKPANYNKETVNNILASTDMGDSEITAEDGPNVIVVLLESFYDVDDTAFLNMSEDPIPFFHSLQRKYSSGPLTVPVVGAGTCNTEFEVLTGMSCQFLGPGEYPQKTILKKKNCESFADVMGDLGYGKHVVHNNTGNFYSRKNAFSQMGFDTFTSKEMLDITDYTPLMTWPTDQILVEATKDTLDSTRSKDFIYTISVETHGYYPTFKILNPPEIEVTAEGKSPEIENQWLYYVNMLKREDAFIKNFIDMLDSRDEPTLVVFFGDHLPTLGLEDFEQASGDLFTTCYATWNNFGMKKIDAPLTSYQLVPEFLNRLGIHGGNILDYNQSMMEQDIEAGSYEYMSNLNMLQYDLLYGKKYAYDGDDPYPASDIVMGVKDVVIDKMYAFAGRLHVYGQNFTSSSKIFVDGKAVPTAYLSGQVLSINIDNLEDGSTVEVCQLGSGNEVFRTSNAKTYHATS